MIDKTSKAVDEREMASAWYKAAVRASAIAAVFFVVVTALLASNHFKLRELDPRTSKAIAALKADLRKHPKDEKLRLTIRKRDRELRSDYFRRLTFARQGSYLLIWGLGVFLIAAPVAVRYRRSASLPSSESENVDGARMTASHGRKSVAALGLLAFGSFGVLAAISHPNLTGRYAQAVRDAKKNAPADSGAPITASTAALSQAAPVAQAAAPAASGPSGTTPMTIGPLPPLNPAMLGTVTGNGNANPSNPSPGAEKPVQIETVAFDPNDYAPSAEDLLKNWATFRGPGGLGVVSGEYPTRWNGAKGDGVIWKAEVPLPGENSPIVWNDRVFLTGATEKERAIFCFDTETGKLLWKHDVEPLEGAKAKAPSVMADTGYAAPTMATDGKRVFAIFANGDVVCCDFDGKRVWGRSLGVPDSTYGHSASLAMFRSLLLIQFDQGSSEKDGKSAILALQGGTGKLVWLTKRPVPNSWSSPIVVNTGGRDELIACANPWVMGYDPLSGREFWRASCLSGDVAPTPVYSGGSIFACNVDACIAAIKAGGMGDITKTHILWQNSDAMLPSIASPVSSGEMVFTVSSEGMLTCFDTKLGKKVWEHDYGISCKASPTIVGSRLYLLDAEGVTHIIEASRTFKEEATAALGEKANATPAFIGDKIFIRGVQRLYCVGAK